MNARNLKILCAFLGLIPVSTGLYGVLTGAGDPLYLANSRDVLLDSNLRFLAGVWLGVGLALYWTLPRLERRTGLFRALWAMIFIGGLGRLVSVAVEGAPSAPFVVFMLLELIGAPVIVWWQSRIAQGASER